MNDSCEAIIFVYYIFYFAIKLTFNKYLSCHKLRIYILFWNWERDESQLGQV